jgi:hypothetical protein
VREAGDAVRGRAHAPVAAGMDAATLGLATSAAAAKTRRMRKVFRRVFATRDALTLDRQYLGERSAAGCRVWVMSRDGVGSLVPRRPEPLSSFSWGHHGTLARELAWALLHDCTGDSALADARCADLGSEVVARLPRESFSLDAKDILVWLEAGAL